MPADEDFQLEQFRALKAEIAANTAEIRSLQRYALVTVAVVWSWIATNPAPWWVAFLPLIFVLLGVLHTLRVLEETGDMGLFIGGAIEPYFEKTSTELLGWEAWLRSKTGKERMVWYRERTALKGTAHHNPLKTAPVWLMWGFLTIAILGVAGLQYKHPLSVAAAKKDACCVPAAAACAQGNK